MHLTDVPAERGNSDSSEQRLKDLRGNLNLVRRSECAVVSKAELDYKRAVCAA
jgi:hypothetical protein